MAVSTWLLFAMAVLGAADMLLFHAIAHDIRRHPPSRHELFAHALRGPTYAALFLAVPNLRLDGTWFAALLVLVAVDLGISIWDFAIEQRSREPLGGLPSGEYLLHVGIAILFGAFVASLVLLEGHRLALAACIAYAPSAVPGVLRAVLATGAVIMLGSGLLDLRAASRMRRR